MIKIKIVISLLITLTIIMGCSSKEERIVNVNNDEIPTENKNISKLPPGLSISIGEETIRPFLIGYSWSYYDEYEDSMATIETESIPPPS